MSLLTALSVFLVISISQTTPVESQITQQCLDCICQASTGCNLSKKCHNSGPSSYFCGPYQISWSYWSDGGRPGDQGGPHDFETCLNNKPCAEQAIYGYMNKWARDCNGDGVIDCSDYAAIHKAGPHSCNAQWLLDSEYWRVFQSSSCASGTGGYSADYASPDATVNNQPGPQYQTQPQPNARTTHWTFPNSRNHSHQPIVNNQPGYRSYGEQPETGRYYNVPSSNNNNYPRHEVFGPVASQPATFPVSNNGNNDNGNGVVLSPYPSNQPSTSSNNGPESESFSSPGQPSTTYNERSNVDATSGPVDSNCLDCLCQASTGCDANKQCFGNVCGPYLISWPFWSDAGRPGTDYVSCALRKNCAESAIQGYMSRFARDCNNDGVINCDDYVMIHQYGPNCGPGVFGTGKFWQDYKTCQQPPIDVRSIPVRESNVERFRPIERPGQPANLRRDETGNWNAANNRFNENEISGVRPVDRDINQPERLNSFHDADSHFNPFSLNPSPPLTNPNLNPVRPNNTNVYFNDVNFPNPAFGLPSPPRGNADGQPPINNDNINPPRNNINRYHSEQPRFNSEQPPIDRFGPEPPRNNEFRPILPRDNINTNGPSEFGTSSRAIELPRTNLNNNNNANGFQPGTLRTDGFRPILNNNPNIARPNSPTNMDSFTTPHTPNDRFTPSYDRPNNFNFPSQPNIRNFPNNNDYFSRSSNTFAPPTSAPATLPPIINPPPTTISPISANDEDVSSLLPASGPRDSRFVAPSRGNGSMTSECLECICEASTKCDASYPCKNQDGAQACGPYQISISYWLKSGKPGYNGGSGDFINCVTNMDCAQDTLKGYIKTMKRDCNNDGAIDCVDYALIHKLGPDACQDQSFLDSPYWNDFQACYGFGR